MPWLKGGVQPELPFVATSRTSRLAALYAEPRAGTQRARVLAWIRGKGLEKDFGATDDEIEEALGMRHQTASARRNELVKGGFIMDSGFERRTRSRAWATVWVVRRSRPTEGPGRSRPIQRRGPT